MRAAVVKRIAVAQALLRQIAEQESAPHQMARQAALGDGDCRLNRFQAQALLLAALTGRQINARAIVHAAFQLGAAQTAVGRQALPQRVLRLAWQRVVAAVKLVNSPQIEAHRIGIHAATQHGAGEQYAVKRRPSLLIHTLAAKALGRNGCNAAAITLPMQEHAARLAKLRHEPGAQVFHVLRRHGHAVTAAPVTGARPGVTRARHHGPAGSVFLHPFDRRFAQARPAMRMHHGHALRGLPACGQDGHQVCAGLADRSKAARIGGHMLGAGYGLRLGRPGAGRQANSQRQAAEVRPGKSRRESPAHSPSLDRKHALRYANTGAASACRYKNRISQRPRAAPPIQERGPCL